MSPRRRSAAPVRRSARTRRRRGPPSVDAITSGSAPASTRAAKVMSPATPAWQLNQATRPGRPATVIDRPRMIRPTAEAAPNPLSMPTTVTPLAHDACIASSAVTPSSAEPYPTLVGTATTGAPVRPPMTLANAPSMPAITITASAEMISSSRASSRCRPATPTSIDEFGIDAIGPQRGDHLVGDGSIARAGRHHHDATIEPLRRLPPEQAAAQLDHAGVRHRDGGRDVTAGGALLGGRAGRAGPHRCRVATVP